jgi:hypothetical protein
VLDLGLVSGVSWESELSSSDVDEEERFRVWSSNAKLGGTSPRG